MYPVSFVERNFSGSRFVLQTDFGAVVARDLNQRGALRREDIYSLGNSLRILVDLQIEKAISDAGGWVYDGARGRQAWSANNWNFISSLTTANFKYNA